MPAIGPVRNDQLVLSIQLLSPTKPLLDIHLSAAAMPRAQDLVGAESRGD